MLDLRFCSALSTSMPTLSRNIPSSYKQKLSINSIEKIIRKLAGGSGMMSSLLLKVCFVLCVRSGLNYKRVMVCIKCGSRLGKRY